MLTIWLSILFWQQKYLTIKKHNHLLMKYLDLVSGAPDSYQDELPITYLKFRNLPEILSTKKAPNWGLFVSGSRLELPTFGL